MKQGIFFLLVLLLFSCKDTQVFDYDVPTNLGYKTIPFALDDSQKGLLFSDLYSDVEYIHLETTEHSLIGSVSKLEIASNGDLIVLDVSNSTVTRFDKNGKYICHIGRCGKGHGEYLMAKDIAFDKFNNHVHVLDMSSCSIHTYDMNGKIQSSVKLDFMPAALSVLDKDYLCVYMNHYDDLSDNSIGHNLKILNRKGVIMSEFMEYDATMNLFQPNSEYTFFQMDSKLYIKQPYSSMIYSIENPMFGTPTIIPEYYIDFGESKIPQEWYRLDFMEMRNKLYGPDEIFYLMSAYKAKDRLLLNVCRNNRVYLYVLDLQDRSRDKYGLKADNDMYGFNSSIFLKNVYGNRCYFVIDPARYDSYKKHIDLEGVEFYTVDKDFKPKVYVPTQKDRDLLDAIHEGDNPIIQVCTLKD